MKAEVLLNALREHGCGLFSGVPCSYLTPLINATIDSPHIHYVNAANEGEAVAICSGFQLGGRPAVAMFQNSGLGNAVSPLTSLNTIFRIPILILVTWRGQPGGPKDEPQHSLVGRVMPQLIETMEIPYSVFPSSECELKPALDIAMDSMTSTGLPYVWMVPHGAIETHELKSSPPPSPSWVAAPTPSTHALDVDEVLAGIVSASQETSAAVLATTGFTGRALYQIHDGDNHFYMVGSMGCVSSLGTGLALACPKRPVIAIDGDGALLMRMGALAAIAAANPTNLTHIVLDNGVHDSTGGQSTLAHTVDIPKAAAACGYPRVDVVGSSDSLRRLLTEESQSLRLIYVRTKPRANRKLPRPTLSPDQVAERLRQWLRS